jgi:hypothetical protein
MERDRLDAYSDKEAWSCDHEGGFSALMQI